MTAEREERKEDLAGRFQKEIAKNPLWSNGDKVLMAVSGGVDSAVLAHLMVQAGAGCAIAHCNFQLRGEESERDEAFTRNLADKLGIPYYVKKLNTYEHAFREGVSTEMAARDLRYEWFGSLLNENDIQWVATGHHADDQIETFFLNLARGTGISGLRGMLPRSGKVIRPLLPFSRKEIQEYATENSIDWIEDSTNNMTEIRRNFIRQKVLPLFEEINPNFRGTLLRSMHDLEVTERFYRSQIRNALLPLTKKDNDELKISISGLLSLEPLPLYLFELLSEFGFNRSSIENVTRSLTGLSGKQFYSASHRLVKDRDHLIITPKPALQPDDGWEYFIDADDTTITDPVHLSCSAASAAGYTIPRDHHVASLDFDKLTFPLTLRRWLPGDTFVPFGMRNSKKLSDFFSDNKLSIPEKENVRVILSGTDIVWIIGHRIDQRYRITAKTKKIFILKSE
jgi:tRNA(Ile)-lysidine synthase